MSVYQFFYHHMNIIMYQSLWNPEAPHSLHIHKSCIDVIMGSRKPQAYIVLP